MSILGGRMVIGAVSAHAGALHRASLCPASIVLRCSPTTRNHSKRSNEQSSGALKPFISQRRFNRDQVIVQSANDEPAVVIDPETIELKKSAGFLRTLSFLSFWSQLALSVVSGLILFFSVAITKQSAGPDISKWAGLVGVILGLLSTFFAHGFNRIAKKLTKDEKVSRGWIVKSLITNNTLNLLGLMSAIIGLQASIGNLVAKSLMTSNGFVYPPVAGSQLASLDIFALQALGNILLSHFISLGFTNLLLRTINKPATQAA